MSEIIKLSLKLGRLPWRRSLAGLPTVVLTASILTTSLFLSGATAMSQQTPQREIVFPISLQWNKQKGVTKYRLQIAADEKFQDVFVDRRVAGNRLMVSDLAPGYYYWRVAPAENEVGEYSRPVRVFVSGGVITTVRLPARTSLTRPQPPALSSRTH